MAAAEPIIQAVRDFSVVDWALPVGSLRRGQDLVGDIAILVAARIPAAVAEHFAGLGMPFEMPAGDSSELHFTVDNYDVLVRCLTTPSAEASLLWSTGSRAHTERLRERAATRGLVLGESGLTRESGQIVASSESAIYAALDLPFIPAEIRNGHDEIERAGRGGVPALVSLDDIRGDLHMHTRWSDGRDSAQEMTEAAAALGYQYIAITDHSQSSAASRNLMIDDVDRQADELARLREQYPRIAILHGCEVDILSDGRLDFPDEILKRFDVVLASLHDRAGHSGDQLLERYEQAMRHPLVSLITHPSNRLFPHRVGYELDYARLFEAAVETGTALEIDGAPSHLDLDSTLARQAAEAGVVFAIDSDCHRSDMLGRYMDLALLTARRGWVEARHVLNTRNLDDVRAAIAAKRR